MRGVTPGSAKRVLVIGAVIDHPETSPGEALSSDGMLIVMERDPARAVQLREKFQQIGLGERAAVIVGDPMRMLHKLAGPFDVIFLGPTEQDSAIGDKLGALLKPGGQLIRGQTP